MWEQVRSYFIKQNEKESILGWLKEKHFMGRWMPESGSFHNLISREDYWSSGFNDQNYELDEDDKKTKKSPFRNFDDHHQYSGIPTTIEHHFEKDDLSKHYSYLPSQHLFDKLTLRYGKEDGTFVNQQNEIVCFDPSLEFDDARSLWVRTQDLITFLKNEELDIVWTLLGEKQYNHNDGRPKYEITEFSGTYIFNIETTEIEGEVKVFKHR